MKLIHLSDLHIGKRVNEFSMIEDQKYILTKILNIIDEENPDGILIAGDVYDKSVPSEEAVRVLDDFLTRLAKRKKPVFMISGNHDSAAKLSFASDLIEMSGVHIAPEYNGTIDGISLEKDGEKVNVYMLPFIRPVYVKTVFPEDAEQIHDYSDAMRVAIDHIGVNTEECNVLVAHQFVVGAERCESEEISVGGLDEVNASVFDCFDYVALGHIHGPQSVGRETIRYSGTPLKYSFSEKDHKKSVTVVEISGKNIEIRTVPLVSKRDMREIKGNFDELADKRNYEGTNREDYIHVVLTDEEDVFDAMGKLRVIYPNIMKLSYDNIRSRESRVLVDEADVERKSPLVLFEEFYESQNNQPMSDTQVNYVTELIEKIWRD